MEKEPIEYGVPVNQTETERQLARIADAVKVNTTAVITVAQMIFVAGPNPFKNYDETMQALIDLAKDNDKI